MTDFGMAKLLGSDPRLTPTYCPGTNAYMSPEALADPPAYTSKLDVFSCGVLFVQIITRKWPDPGPRTRSVQVDNDPRFPSGCVHVDVPELERRKEHLDLISPTHPLLEVALDCLKDKEGQRPTAEQLCSCLIALKESAAYRDSLQQTPEEMTGQTPLARDQELEQQLREKVEDLTREVQQLTLQNEEQAHNKGREIQQQQIGAQSLQKDQEIRLLQQQIQTKMGEIQQLRQQLQSSRRESEQVVAALQQSVEQKDAIIREKDELLQEKEREIRELQQRVREREGSGVATGPLKLKWREGPPAPFATYGHSAAVTTDTLYCCDGLNDTKILMFDSKTEQWTILSECPRKFFSLAILNGQITSIGGEHSGKTCKTLLSFTEDRDLSKRKWIEQFPPMTYCRSNPAVIMTNASLIVAGGWEGNTEKLATVEVMDTQTFLWSTVASLPYPLFEATTAICGERLYLGGGLGSEGKGRSVLVCKLKDLFQSRSQSLSARLRRQKVWKEVTQLPVMKFSLVAFQGQVLAVGGGCPLSGADSTSDVRQFDATTNTWSVIGQMRSKRHRSFAAVLSDDTLIVCGGFTPDGPTASVEIASILNFDH